MKDQSQSKLDQLVVKSFPLHYKKELMTYNLYCEDSVKGITESTIIKYPCVRQGCMTNCYFDVNISPSLIDQPCSNCGNNSFKRIFLDIGFKMFLEKHRKYIMVNQPLDVEINPISKEYIFSTGLLKNHLISQMSSYIANKLFDDFNFKQTIGINSQILDFAKLNDELEAIMTPTIKEERYYLYSFCKYVPQPTQQDKNYILLFVFGQSEPIKSRIILQNSSNEICSNKTYQEHVMINFIGERNTLIIAVPVAGCTQYYVSSLDHHFNLEERTLKVVHMKDWKDSQARFNGSLIVDQKSCSIFMIGGYDNEKNDSLDYISCFIKCRWEKESNERLEFKAEMEKSHRLFQGQLGTYNTGVFNTVFKNPYNQKKIAFRNSSFMIYSFNREYGEDLQAEIAANTKKMQKDFFNLGGRLKDSTIFATGRFSTKQPGIRYLKYDTTLNENPIINESTKGDLNFVGNNYIIIELPCFVNGQKRKFKNHCLVLGGQKDNTDKEKKAEEPDFRKIYCVDTNRLEQSITLSEKFHLSSALPDVIDQFTVILADPKGKNQSLNSNHYLRATYPLKKPAKIVKDKEEFYVHYIILEFGLGTGLFEVLPGVMPKVN